MGSMRRRLIAATAASAIVTPFAAFAQSTPRVARIGRLTPLSVQTEARHQKALLEGLRDLGWIEGKNLKIEYRYAEGQTERLPRLAAELAALKVDVIVAGSTPGAFAAKNATSTIPIVMVTTGDPVANGLVNSLSRPGGNITGMTTLAQALGGKRLEFFKEAIPAAKRIAVLVKPNTPDREDSLHEVNTAARTLGIDLDMFEARNPPAIESAFVAMKKNQAAYLMVLQDAMFLTRHLRIVELAAQHRLPAIYALRDFVTAGGLMYYGVDLVEMYRSAAGHIDKILKGAKPAEIPVEQPTKFELVINLKTAKALGLRIPASVLLRADKVIE